jgi:hypothetical protein
MRETAMSIAKLEDWERELAGDPLLDLLADNDPPGLFDDAYADEDWRSVFRRFATAEFCVENLDFMGDVEDFDRHLDATHAVQIYTTWITSGQLNLDSSTKADIDDAMSGAVDKQLNDYFKAAYDHCFQLMKHDTYPRFKLAAAKGSRRD